MELNALQRNIQRARLDNPFYTGARTNPIFPLQVNPINAYALRPFDNLYSPISIPNFGDFTNAARAEDYSGVQEIGQDSAKKDLPEMGLGQFLECFLSGGRFGCPDSVTVEPPKGGWSIGNALGQYFKTIGLLGLALILVAFGLYFLAKSTDTGKAAIKLATA